MKMGAVSGPCTTRGISATRLATTSRLQAFMTSHMPSRAALWMARSRKSSGAIRPANRLISDSVERSAEAPMLRMHRSICSWGSDTNHEPLVGPIRVRPISHDYISRLFLLGYSVGLWLRFHTQCLLAALSIGTEKSVLKSSQQALSALGFLSTELHCALSAAASAEHSGLSTRGGRSAPSVLSSQC